MHLLVRIAEIVDKERKTRLDGTCLVYILHVQREMKAFAKEHYACRIAIHSVDTDGGIACRISKKRYILVGVC